MRKIILIAAATLASCGGNQQANNAAVAEETEGMELTSANDATAIDAATGEAANMAADVSYTFDENEVDAPAAAGSNETGTSTPPRPARRPASQAAPSDSAPSQPPANTAAPAPAAGNSL
jgi:hypothetical protein